MRTKKPHKPAPELSAAEIERALKKLGKLIKERRKKEGASLEDFSYEIGVSRSALFRFEDGGDLMVSSFFKVLHGHGVNPNEVVNLLKK